MDEVARSGLAAAVLPWWIAVGLLDWACHRRTRIEATGGLPENAFHWLLFAQMGVAAMALLLLAPTAGALLLAAAAWTLHELTVYLELRYAVPRREIGPFEQMVHSGLELLPLVLLGGSAALVWPRLAAPEWALRWQPVDWPPAGWLALVAGVLLLNLLPLAEETLRCRRGRGAR